MSCLVANPARDSMAAYQQQATRDWWQVRQSLFQCVTSDETRAEAGRGDAGQVRLRPAMLAQMPSAPVTLEAENLAAEVLGTEALPVTAQSEAVHRAVATLL